MGLPSEGGLPTEGVCLVGGGLPTEGVCIPRGGGVCINCTETIEHLFYECDPTQKYWDEVIKLCRERNIDGCTFELYNILLNNVHPNGIHMINFLTLIMDISVNVKII